MCKTLHPVGPEQTFPFHHSAQYTMFARYGWHTQVCKSRGTRSVHLNSRLSNPQMQSDAHTQQVPPNKTLCPTTLTCNLMPYRPQMQPNANTLGPTRGTLHTEPHTETPKNTSGAHTQHAFSFLLALMMHPTGLNRTEMMHLRVCKRVFK